MFFKIDLGSPTAVYQQLMDQVKREYAAGRLRPGDQLPTIREVAAELRVNRNTIAKVYSELESEGLLVNRPGQGSFVTEGGGARWSVEAIRGDLKERVDSMLSQAKVYGWDRGQIGALLEERLSVFFPKVERGTNSSSKIGG